MVTFSEMLLKLQEFWAKQGCNIVQPYDIPAGAGTFHPATLLRSLSSTNLISCLEISNPKNSKDCKYKY